MARNYYSFSVTICDLSLLVASGWRCKTRTAYFPSAPANAYSIQRHFPPGAVDSSHFSVIVVISSDAFCASGSPIAILYRKSPYRPPNGIEKSTEPSNRRLRPSLECVSDDDPNANLPPLTAFSGQLRLVHFSPEAPCWPRAQFFVRSSLSVELCVVARFRSFYLFRSSSPVQNVPKNLTLVHSSSHPFDESITVIS